MKNTLQINASFDRPDLLEQMVEQLAGRKNLAFNPDRTGDWKPIETSSTETYVSGTVQLETENNEPQKALFITRFLFTCSHDSSAPYKLQWSASCN